MSQLLVERLSPVQGSMSPWGAVIMVKRGRATVVSADDKYRYSHDTFRES